MEKRSGKTSYRLILAAVVCLFVGVSACQSDNDAEADYHYHPDSTDWDTVENLVTADFRSLEQAGMEITNLFPDLSAASETMIAQIQAPEQAVLPLRSEEDNEGNVYIRNSNENTVDVYSAEGAHLYSVGSPELLLGFTLSPDYQTLYVMDINNTEVFKRNGGEFESYDSFFHGLRFATGICASNDAVFMSGQGLMPEAAQSVMNQESSVEDHNEFQGPVTVYSRDDYEFQRTFGRAIESQFGRAASSAWLSESHLACFPEQDTIVTFNKHFGQADAYRLDGERLWSLNLENFAGVRFRESREFQLAPLPEDSDRTYMHSLSAVTDQPYAVLGFMHTSQGSSDQPITVKSVLLDIRDGSMMELTRDQDLVTSLSSSSAVIQRFTEDGNIEVYLNR